MLGPAMQSPRISHIMPRTFVVLMMKCPSSSCQLPPMPVQLYFGSLGVRTKPISSQKNVTKIIIIRRGVFF